MFTPFKLVQYPTGFHDSFRQPNWPRKLLSNTIPILSCHSRHQKIQIDLKPRLRFCPRLAHDLGFDGPFFCRRLRDFDSQGSKPWGEIPPGRHHLGGSSWPGLPCKAGCVPVALERGCLRGVRTIRKRPQVGSNPASPPSLPSHFFCNIITERRSVLIHVRAFG